ncbi:hypothetical protein V8E53_003799 [Lactarius tabidus]
MASNSPEDRASSGGVGSDDGSASMGTISPGVTAAAGPLSALYLADMGQSWFHNTAPTMRCTTKFNTGGSGSGTYVLRGTEGTGWIERPHLYHVFRSQIQWCLATSLPQSTASCPGAGAARSVVLVTMSRLISAQHRRDQPPEGAHDVDIQGPTGHQASLRDLWSADAFRLRKRRAGLEEYVCLMFGGCRARLEDGDEGKLFGFGLLLTYEDPYYVRAPTSTRIGPSRRNVMKNCSKYARCPFSHSLDTPLSDTGWRILSKGIPPKRLPHLDGSTSALGPRLKDIVQRQAPASPEDGPSTIPACIGGREKYPLQLSSTQLTAVQKAFLNCLVRNKPASFLHMSGILAGRGFNIDLLGVSPTPRYGT